MVTRTVAAGLALALTALAAPAFADESAEALKEKGNQAMMQLNYADALTAYRAALAKNPNDVALHYNIGRAQQARGDYVAALDALLEFERRAPAETKAKVPTLSQLIADVKSRVGELHVRCSVFVEKGVLLVGGTKLEEGCSIEPKRLRVSLATKTASLEVRFESETYQAPGVNVMVAGGGPPVDVAITLQPKSTSGVLRVVTMPAAALVSVDGEEKGNAPVEVSLLAGPHALDVKADGHESAHVPFVIEAGKRKEVPITLEKTPPITKRWWFWTGAGVLAAGLVTTVAILYFQPERENSKPGSIPPGIISAPLVTF